jgi:tripartite-type tricarboxylate transporter receptor subunit TctC
MALSRAAKTGESHPFIGHRRGMALLAALALAVPLAVHADTFPDKPIRIVVQTTPGGTLDFLGRLLAQKLGETWNRGLLVENRGGAGGVIGAAMVANSAPDGYTLGVMAAMLTVSAAVQKKLPYDRSLRGFTAVSLLGYGSSELVVNPDLPVHSVADLIALAKKRPGTIDYASSGTGGALHIAMEMFKSMTNTNMVHIPYPGTDQAVNDVMAGRTQVTITGIQTAVPLAKAGKLRIIAGTGSHRSRVLPDVPTIGETVPGYAFDNFYGIFVPAGTPAAVVQTLHDNIRRVMLEKTVQARLLAQGFEPADVTSAQFGQLVQTQLATYTALAKKLNISLN